MYVSCNPYVIFYLCLKKFIKNKYELAINKYDIKEYNMRPKLIN